MLKGWIERVWVNGVAWELPAGPTGCAAGCATSAASSPSRRTAPSKLVNALEGEVGKRMVSRTLRALCHPLARTTVARLLRRSTPPTDDKRADASSTSVERQLS